MSFTEHSASKKLMGSHFSIKILHSDASEALNIIESAFQEIERIENILSEFKDSSEIGRINQNAGKQKVKVRKEVYDLLCRCVEISKKTSGAFDITIGNAKSLYSFDKSEKIFPKKDIIEKSRHAIGFQNLILGKNNTVFLNNPESRISLAAIGKGYAADVTKLFLINKGIGSGIVNASGDITAWGLNSKNKPWNIGIPHPDIVHEILLELPLFNKSIATSGDTFQFFTTKNKKYSHTLDPSTALPINHIKSVSVVHSSAEICDALATAVYVLGAKKGLELIDSYEGIYAIIINKNNEVHFSKNIEFNQ